MTDNLLVIGGACCLVVLALVVMAGLHENHYRDRRSRILDAQLEGLHGRVAALEGILREDRLT